MSYELQQPSINPFDIENWKRIGYYFISNIAVSIFVVIALLIVSMLTGGKIFNTITTILISVAAVSLSLSTYEYFRGCHIKKY